MPISSKAIDGSWWAVFLASRIYGQTHYNTGRETYLLPVTWKDGWPTILEPGRAIPQVAPGPAFMDSATAQQAPMSGNFTWRDEFDRPTLDRAWLQVRVPKRPWFDFSTQPGHLTIQPLSDGLDSLRNPSFLARRQQHLEFESSTALDVPGTPGTDAGIAAFQNEAHWYFLGVRRKRQGRGTVPAEEQRRHGADRRHHDAGQAAEVAATEDRRRRWRVLVRLRSRQRLDWLRQDEDGTVLSTDVAGGFVGAMVGPYARATQDP